MQPLHPFTPYLRSGKIRASALVLLCLSVKPAMAQTPITLQSTWTEMARAQDAGYAPSASRGRALYEQTFRNSAELPSCTSCHTHNPTQPGRHSITSKSIAALSPTSNPQRFTDRAKSEKWFKRNCNDVMGRECTAAEKADLLEFLMRGGK